MLLSVTNSNLRWCRLSSTNTSQPFQKYTHTALDHPVNCTYIHLEQYMLLKLYATRHPLFGISFRIAFVQVRLYRPSSARLLTTFFIYMNWRTSIIELLIHYMFLHHLYMYICKYVVYSQFMLNSSLSIQFVLAPHFSSQ